MTGSDLRCPKCGAVARDVAPDFDLSQFGSFDGGRWGILWTCLNGHQHITRTGRVGHKGELSHMPIGPEKTGG